MPWWWPQKANEDYRDRTGWKYSDTWDNLKDARYQFEALADAFLKLVKENGKKPEDF